MSTSQNPQCGVPCTDALSVFPRCLRSDPSIALWGISPALEVLGASDAACSLLFGRAQGEVVGQPLAKLVPSRAVERVRDMGSAARARNAPVVGRAIWRDQRVRSIYTASETIAGAVFVVTRPDPLSNDDTGPAGEVDDADFITLDTFDALTPREFQVLAYFGQGLRIAGIADRMGRSPKTIDNHKARLSQKLGVNSRAELMTIAREAGIEPHLAELPRVRFSATVPN